MASLESAISDLARAQIRAAEMAEAVSGAPPQGTGGNEEIQLRTIQEQRRALESHEFWSLRARIQRGLFDRALASSTEYNPRPLIVPRWYFDTPLPSQAPSVSIVTPSFRSGEFLERTLTSVLDQDYPELEFVVQDGGSDDETADVLEQYGNQLTAVVVEPDEVRPMPSTAASPDHPVRSWHT